MQYQISDVSKNFGKYLSGMQRTSHGNDFEVILTVKIETRPPTEGPFGSEFPATCNHCKVMMA